LSSAAYVKGCATWVTSRAKRSFFELRFARANLDALLGLAAELVRLPVDLIVTDGASVAKAALDATHTIPLSRKLPPGPRAPCVWAAQRCCYPCNAERIET